VRPRLIHPVEVVIAQVDPGATVVDADFEQPVGEVVREPVTLRAQQRLTRGNMLRQGAAGADPLSNAVGHLVFEVDALHAAGVTLHVGDRITRIGGVEVDHRVLALEDRAPYAGRFWHRYAVFGPERAASG
jgi:hypothetical protein